MFCSLFICSWPGKCSIKDGGIPSARAFAALFARRGGFFLVVVGLAAREKVLNEAPESALELGVLPALRGRSHRGRALLPADVTSSSGGAVADAAAVVVRLALGKEVVEQVSPRSGTPPQAAYLRQQPALLRGPLELRAAFRGEALCAESTARRGRSACCGTRRAPPRRRRARETPRVRVPRGHRRGGREARGAARSPRRSGTS